MKKEFKIINSKEILKGNVLTFTRNEIQLPNNKKTNWDLILHPGASCIALFDTSDNKYFMVEQYRLGTNKYELEFCAGKIDNNEDPLNTIIRESEEELGYKAKNIKYLGKIHPSFAFINEVIHLYYGEVDKKMKQNLDSDEFLTITKKSYDEINNLINNGTITDAKTICLFHMLKKQ